MSRSYKSQRSVYTTTFPSPAPFFRFDGESLAGSDGAAISTVTDAGGGALTLTQSTGAKKPLLVKSRLGYKGLRFTQASVTEINSATGGITGAGAHTMMCAYYNWKAVSAYAPIMSCGPTNGITSSLGTGYDGSVNLWGGGSGSGAGDAAPSLAIGAVGRISIIAKVYTGTTAELWAGGARGAEPVAKTYTVSSAAFGLGTPWIGGAACPNVDVLGAAWWNTALTGAQLAAAFRWFARRYNISATQRIIYVGDSIAYGLRASTASKRPPNALQALLKRPTNIANQGHSGISLATLATSAQIQTDFGATLTMGPPAIAVVHAGTNDLSGAALTGTQLLAVQAQYYASLKAIGVGSVVVHSILNRGGGMEAQRTIYNNALRAASAGTYFDVFVDLDLDPGLADNTSGSYDADNVHPNDTGCATIAAYDAAVIPALI